MKAAGLGLVALLAAAACPESARAAISAPEASSIRSANENRIEALTILGSDFGFTDGTFDAGDAQTAVHADITKLGGSGEIGEPQPISHSGVGWQPKVQGSMGYLDSTARPQTPLLRGDSNHFRTFGIEFGGGARFWLSDAFSLAPTVMGIYGHTVESYSAISAFIRDNLAQATQLGLIASRVDTWTVRPALNLQYLIRWRRAIVTLSSDATYFHTGGLRSSNANVAIAGDSGTFSGTVDVDVPLGIELFGHELRSGGYFTHTVLSGDLRRGLSVPDLNEIHPRLVVDVLRQLWKAQWIGIGGSYVWGPGITGWTIGADVTFRF